MKVKVTIKQTQTATFDIGDLPLNMIRDILVANDGTFDDTWSLGDIRAAESWTTDSVEVEPAPKSRGL